MKIFYFFDGRFSHPDHEHCIMALKKLFLEGTIQYEAVNVAVWKNKSFTEALERYGVLSFPMICTEEKVLCYDLVRTSSELSLLLHVLDSLPCLRDSLLLYS